MTPTFEIDIFQTGFEQLCQAVDKAVARTDAQVILTGMEPSSHYFENLARHLQQGERPVTLINSFAVKENRDQQMMLYEKDDEIASLLLLSHIYLRRSISHNTTESNFLGAYPTLRFTTLSYHRLRPSSNAKERFSLRAISRGTSLMSWARNRLALAPLP